jgi:TatD DNase family protein
VTLVDIGANLTNRAFAGDLDDVLARAHDAGVGAIIVTGTSIGGSAHASRIAVERARASSARGHSHQALRLASTAGIHPHHASTFGPLALASLRESLAEPHVVAVGECGLDWNRSYSPRADQLACFEAQLSLAADVRKPVFLHERDAADDFTRVLARHRANIVGGVVHCFTGDGDALARYLDMDLYVGITGWICDERRGMHLRDLVRRIPRDRLLVETDAPYLFPRDLDRTKRRNEPSFVAHVAKTVASARGDAFEDLARFTSENARRLFALGA